ncbi:RNA polymeras-like protein II mediator complex subunit 10 [Lophiotrema nucula]|uniref:Mediator of RNA polymerase II transcription subunit 10 n=1 Tax=Lophiotrema nucula TaxID=690887 RepID=A0A6A5YJS5_9PLEO|nr:RNA polymeras-like protein II mediator complex subunit 10 [Lophiotrema nucula]
MANRLQDPIDSVEQKLKEIVQNLYNLIVQALEHQGSSTEQAMKREITSLIQNLVTVSREAPRVAIDIPPEVTAYVEGSRNPDIFTREFVELAQRMNQMLKGRSEGYLLLLDCMLKDCWAAFPENRAELIKLAESHGGQMPEGLSPDPSTIKR